MPKFQPLLSAAALVFMTLPALAQVGSLSDGSLAMGESVETTTAPETTGAEDVTSEIIGDWDLQCAKSGAEPRPCRMYQLIRNNDGHPVLEVTLYRLATPEGNAVAGATFVAPLETLLTAQLTVSVDGENAKRYPFAFCNQIGCFARIGLSQEDVDAYKSGEVASIVIVPAIAPDQVVTVNMSLAGFAKAFDNATPVAE